MMSSKLVDPIHLFLANGHSVMAFEALVAENATLKARNEQLEKQLRSVIEQRKLSAEEKPQILH